MSIYLCLPRSIYLHAFVSADRFLSIFLRVSVHLLFLPLSLCLFIAPLIWLFI